MHARSHLKCTYNFGDACKIASNVITSANYNSARSHSGGSTEQNVRLLTHNDRPSGTNQSLYGHNNSREDSNLLQAAQRLERRDEMRRQGVNPPPHRMRDRHHLRIRRIDHQTADDTFGHYGVTPMMLKATLNSRPRSDWNTRHQLPPQINCTAQAANPI